MIKIITVGKIYLSDTKIEKFEEFLKSNNKFFKTTEGKGINVNAIMGYEEAREAYWDGYLLDETESFFIRDGDKIKLSPQEKKEIHYEEIKIISNSIKKLK